jgi:hypothetical protein
MTGFKYFLAAVLLMLPALAAIAQGPGDITADSDLETARQVKDYYADWLSSIPGVSGVGVGNTGSGEPAIIVNVQQMTPQIKQIPDKLNGIPVVVTSPQGDTGTLLSSEPLEARGFMPSPTPEVEISPVPTPQGNELWPYPQHPFPNNPGLAFPNNPQE